MGATEAETILQSMQVDGWSSIYVLGCNDRRVTVYSQQVRALNLAAALVASERVKGETVVVVGGGVAGLTCAAGLRALGAGVVVLEAQRELLPVLRGGSTRWLHPGVYDWPLDGWDRDRAGLPLLDWKNGTVEAVRQQLEAGWATAGSGVAVRCGVSDVRLGGPGDGPRKITWSPGGSQRTKAVVLAVGFGLEPTPLATERRYWEGDDLDARRIDGAPRRWLVSGCGDGALTDLFRLCLAGFRHDRMLHDFTGDPRMAGIRAEIRRIEADAAIQDDAARLHDAYAELDAPWVVEAMQARRRDDTKVKLAVPSADFLTRTASPLNRFLAGQLHAAGMFEIVPSKVVSAEPDGAEVVVRYKDETSERFDRIQRRHGPMSALGERFPAVARAMESNRAQQRRQPTLMDQTCTRFWAEGVFGEEAPGASANDHASFVPEAVVPGGHERRTEATARVFVSHSDESGAYAQRGRALTPDFQSYRRLAIARHRLLPLVGFNERVRVAIGLDDLYVELDVVLDHGRADRMVFNDAEHARKRLSADARVHRIPFSKAFELARACDKRGLAFLGDPGSGKTTELKRVLLNVLSTDSGRGPGVLGLPELMLPVFLPLRNLQPGEKLVAFMQRELDDETGGVAPDLAEQLLRRGNLLLLLDGLDEVADQAERRRVARWIERLCAKRADYFFVVSSRFSGYTPDVKLDTSFLELHLRAMNAAQVRRFVHNWYNTVEAAEVELARRVAQLAGTTLGSSGVEDGNIIELLADFRVPEEDHAEAEGLLANFEQPGFRDAQLYALTTNPLLLTALCLVYREHCGELPNSRGALLRECTTVLLQRWRRRRPEDHVVVLEPEQAQQVLQLVALWMHGEDGRTRASASELNEPVRRGLARVKATTITASDFLRRIRDESGLLTGWGLTEYGFMHLGFQEHLAALELRDTAGAWRRPSHVLRELAGRFGRTWWQEVILLMFGQGDAVLFERFIRCLMEQSEFEQWMGSTLMSQILGQWKGEALAGLDEALLSHTSLKVRRWWRRQRGLERAVGESIIAPRGGVELVLVPGGRFLKGSPEGSQQEVELASFYLARTPVTNSQYGEYLIANSREHRPDRWGERQYNQPEQPVTGVSWDEACAYCHWAGLVLPTEAQWEYACRAGTTTQYWSGDTEEDLAEVGWYSGNSSDQLHPVGQLDANAFGLYDMHGNVYEWCEDDWVGSLKGAEYRSGDGLRIQPASGAKRVVRGGAFNGAAHCARSAYRNGFGPWERVPWLSFRPAFAASRVRLLRYLRNPAGSET